MSGDLQPEDVLGQLEKGYLFPFYLFHGPSEFRLEQVLNRVRRSFIPEEARELNVQIFYGDETDSSTIIDAARSFPFISKNRLIIVRRTEDFTPAALENFIPYLERAVESTCLIFVSSKPDFRKKFYSMIRKSGRAVNFRKLYGRQLVPWIKKMAKDLGLNIENQACAHLQQIVGDRLRDLHSELEKIYLRYGEKSVGVAEVKEIAIYSRVYTIFELMDEVSFRRRAESLSILHKFVDEEGKSGILKVMGMLNRQIRLLWQAKSILEDGGRTGDVSRQLGLQGFQVKRLVPQSKCWRTDDLEHAFHLLYKADGRLKSGGQEELILENVILSLCG